MCFNVLIMKFSDKCRENSIKQFYFKYYSGIITAKSLGACQTCKIWLPLNENLWGEAQKSPFNKPPRRFSCPLKLELHGCKELPCTHHSLQQLSAHGSSCSIYMPPLPICCLLYHFGANVDTLSFHPWIFLCQSLKNKNLYGKKTFKIITTMLLSPWVVLTCSQV